MRQATSSLAPKLASRPFLDVGSVDNFIAEQENKARSLVLKTQRDVKLLETVLGNRKVEEIPALELSEYICDFIISVRPKDRKDYEPSLLRSLLASFLSYRC